jgi:hypothetical protein
MREIDRRSKYDRRVFLKGAATAVPTVAIATSAGLSVSDAWADDATTLTPATLKTLVKVARDIYPHDFLGDSLLHHCGQARGTARRQRIPRSSR